MPERKALTFALAVLGVAIVVACAAPFASGRVARVSPDELKAMMDAGDVTVIDVRLGKDWEWSEHKIRGAVKQNPLEVPSWAPEYRQDQNIVLY